MARRGLEGVESGGSAAEGENFVNGIVAKVPRKSDFYEISVKSLTSPLTWGSKICYNMRVFEQTRGFGHDVRA